VKWKDRLKKWTNQLRGESVFQSYYRDVTDPNNDFENRAVSLQVNCAGRERHGRPMQARAVRRDQYLYYQMAGTVSVSAPSVCRLRAGDLMWFQDHVPFAYRDEETTEHCFVHFTGTAAEEWLEKAGLTPHTVYHVTDDAVEDGFHRLFCAFLRRDAQFDTETAAALLSLLSAIGRSIGRGEDGATRFRLERSLQYIHDHMTERITLATLARLENLSESRYRTLFCETMKQPPLAYVLALRMDAACRLLKNSVMSVQEIAQTVGYEDPHYFSRVFRQKMGVTPLAYRFSK